MRARKKGDMYLGKVSNYINQNMAKFKQIYIRYVASIFCAFIIAVVTEKQTEMADRIWHNVCDCNRI